MMMLLVKMLIMISDAINKDGGDLVVTVLAMKITTIVSITELMMLLMKIAMVIMMALAMKITTIVLKTVLVMLLMKKMVVVVKNMTMVMMTALGDLL